MAKDSNTPKTNHFVTSMTLTFDFKNPCVVCGNLTAYVAIDRDGKSVSCCKRCPTKDISTELFK